MKWIKMVNYFTTARGDEAQLFEMRKRIILRIISWLQIHYWKVKGQYLSQSLLLQKG